MSYVKEFDMHYNDNFQSDEPSETFLSSCDRFGSSEAQCDCGKTHYALLAVDCTDADYSYQEYVLSQYEEDKENTVIHHDDNFVHTVLLAGRTFVIGCECKTLKKYENFIWEQRNVIRSYLKHRVKLEKHWADEENLMNALSIEHKDEK